jgi:hypothetical protein
MYGDELDKVLPLQSSHTSDLCTADANASVTVSLVLLDFPNQCISTNKSNRFSAHTKAHRDFLS